MGSGRRVAGGDVLEALDDGRLAAAVLAQDEDEGPGAGCHDLAGGGVPREGGEIDDLDYEFRMSSCTITNELRVNFVRLANLAVIILGTKGAEPLDLQLLQAATGHFAVCDKP